MIRVLMRYYLMVTITPFADVGVLKRSRYATDLIWITALKAEVSLVQLNDVEGHPG